ncbi:MAG: ABC transporter ATP-binding protein [Faecousia sp.]
MDRYFTGLKNNPKEEKRVAKETAKREQRLKRNRNASKVVPANLIDLELTQRNLEKNLTDLRDSYRQELAQETVKDYRLLAQKMLDHLQAKQKESVEKVTKQEAYDKAIRIMSDVGIKEPEKRFNQYPHEFSGGMRQRIVIAIAIAANPEILLCDEPTTALDVTIQAQILELINEIKRKRNLSVLFITHDLGVVANMADKVAVMYAGKIVEYGTVDDIFYDPKHPYTWALLSSMPSLDTKEKLEAIPGTPPNMIYPPKGDPFADRNKYAMEIDFKREPPFFKVSDTHYAATWLLHPDAPKIDPPKSVTDRIKAMREMEGLGNA